MCVSIHAPVRGATSKIWYINYDNLFQSTPPCGGRPKAAVIIKVSGFCFNPRPRAGGDSGGNGTHFGYAGFNPRPRAGGDKQTPSGETPASVSIHAPVRGATGRCLSTAVGLRGFNPRPRAGGDLYSCSESMKRYLFQSTPPCGGRQFDQAKFTHRVVSIHAPVRGATAYLLSI